MGGSAGPLQTARVMLSFSPTNAPFLRAHCSPVRGSGIKQSVEPNVFQSPLESVIAAALLGEAEGLFVGNEDAAAHAVNESSSCGTRWGWRVAGGLPRPIHATP